MDNIKGDASCPPNPHEIAWDIKSSQQPKLPVQSLPNAQDDIFADDVDSGDYVYDTESSEDDDDMMENIKSNRQVEGIAIGGNVGNGDDDDDDGDTPNGYNRRRIRDDGLNKQEKKKRKLENMLSRYEFAPRVVVTPPVSKRTRAGRNSLTDWTEQESFVLLEAWGERYLKHNRKNVRSEEWAEVAEKVSEVSKLARTETQCRNRLDTLKKKYKKEKALLAESIGISSKWVYFSKMDMILSPSSIPENGHVSMDSKVNLLNPENGPVSMDMKVNPNHANSSDEMKVVLVDDLESAKDASDNLEDLPSKKTKMPENRGGEDPFKLIADSISKLCDGPFKLLADSINKFCDIYEKVESSKSKQLDELEKMRMDYRKGLELEKSKIVKRAQVEMAKIWGLTSKDLDDSPGTASG